MMKPSGGITTIGPMTTGFGPTTMLGPAPTPPLALLAQIALTLAISLGAFLAVYLPAHLFQPGHSPTVEVEADGYLLRYTAPLASGQVTTDLYIARDNTGRCFVGNAPSDWNTSLCDIRLQQIEARNCKLLADFDDAQCHALPLRTGRSGELRKARIIFTLREGEPIRAREAGRP